MKEIFYENSMISEFKAKIIKVEKIDDDFVYILDKTAFFYEGGGQDSDTGVFISLVDDIKIDIFYCYKENDNIYHKSKEYLAVDTEIIGKIDFEKRYSLMQNHLGEHIISGIVNRKYGFNNVGFHMGEFTTIDFDGILSYEQLLDIEKEANIYVQKSIPIKTYIAKEDDIYRSKKEIFEAVRIVEIENVDKCACCAPHFSNTGYVGIIKILDVKKYKKGVRVTMLAGNKALKYLADIYEMVKEISVHTSKKPFEIKNKVIEYEEKIYNLNGKIINLSKDNLISKLESRNKDEHYVLETDIDFSIVLNVLKNYETNKIICILKENNKGYQFAFISKNVDEDIKIFNDLNVKIGGKKLLTGMIFESMEKILEKLENYNKSF